MVRFRTSATAAIILLLSLALLWFFGRPALRDWRYRRAIAGADTFLKENRLREASLLARQALGLRPSGQEALKLMVALAARVGGPDVLIWQQQLCEARPDDVAAQLTLARSALRFRETMVADAALGRVPPAARRSTAWLELAAGVAAQHGLRAQAEGYLQQAITVTPDDASLQLDLASVRLLSSEAAVATSAHEEVKRLADLPACRLIALRNLLADARRKGDGTSARSYAERLGALPEATAGDRLTRFEELRKSDEPRFRAALEKLLDGATDSPATVAGLMEWLNANDLGGESARWFARLEESTRTMRPIAPAAAEALAGLGEWESLRKLATAGDWGALEFMRHAFRACAEARGSSNPRSQPFVAAWDQAIAATHGNYSALMILARMAQSWKWQDRAEQVWWFVARRPAGQRPALKALFSQYRADGDTAHLYEVSRRTLEIDPNDPIAKNNSAALALLLGRDLAEAHRLAAELHRAFPTQPGIASTRAFSLVLQKEPAEALKVIQTLPPPALADPSVAFYRAIALANLGRLDEARPALSAAIERRDFLPEEKSLAARLTGRE